MPMPPMPDLPEVAPTTALKQQPSRASEIMRYGFPGFDNLRTFEDYVLSYDQRNRLHFLYAISLSLTGNSKFFLGNSEVNQ